MLEGFKMGQKLKDIIRLPAARMVDWDKHFGIGLWGAVLSVIAGLLILVSYSYKHHNGAVSAVQRTI